MADKPVRREQLPELVQLQRLNAGSLGNEGHFSRATVPCVPPGASPLISLFSSLLFFPTIVFLYLSPLTAPPRLSFPFS